MANVFARIRHFWRDKVVGPQLPTYDAACEELGGAPWRMKPDKTDRWFVAQQFEATARRLTPPEAFLALETGNIDLKKRMSERTKLLLLGGAALAVIAACAFSLAARPTSAAASDPRPGLAAVAVPAAPSATSDSAAQSSPPAPVDAPAAVANAHPAPRAALPPRTLRSDDTRTRVASAKRYTLARHRRR